MPRRRSQPRRVRNGALRPDTAAATSRSSGLTRTSRMNCVPGRRSRDTMRSAAASRRLAFHIARNDEASRLGGLSSVSQYDAVLERTVTVRGVRRRALGLDPRPFSEGAGADLTWLHLYTPASAFRRHNPRRPRQGAAVDGPARPLTTRDTILLITHAAGDQVAGRTVMQKLGRRPRRDGRRASPQQPGDP